MAQIDTCEQEFALKILRVPVCETQYTVVSSPEAQHATPDTGERNAEILLGSADSRSLTPAAQNPRQSSAARGCDEAGDAATVASVRRSSTVSIADVPSAEASSSAATSRLSRRTLSEGTALPSPA